MRTLEITLEGAITAEDMSDIQCNNMEQLQMGGSMRGAGVGGRGGGGMQQQQQRSPQLQSQLQQHQHQQVAAYPIQSPMQPIQYQQPTPGGVRQYRNYGGYPSQLPPQQQQPQAPGYNAYGMYPPQPPQAQPQLPSYNNVMGGIQQPQQGYMGHNNPIIQQINLNKAKQNEHAHIEYQPEGGIYPKSYYQGIL